MATPAYLDWRARLNELHEAGLRIESLVHWSRGVEVQHVPPNIQRALECNGALPPPLVAACVDLACQRCQSRRGGFQWPVVGAFTRAECRVSGCHQWKLGAGLRSMRRGRSGLCVSDLAPAQRVAGQTHPRLLQPTELWLAWRDGQGGVRAWVDPSMRPVPSQEQARVDSQALWFWLGIVQADDGTGLYCSCLTCGLPAGLPVSHMLP